MGTIFRQGKVKSNERQINLTIYSSSDFTHYAFCLPARMVVRDFIELALKRLARGKGAERVQELKNNYEPVLELPTPEGGRELPSDISLFEAGVFDHAICRIVARPRKERIMFCRYTDYS